MYRRHRWLNRIGLLIPAPDTKYISDSGDLCAVGYQGAFWHYRWREPIYPTCNFKSVKEAKKFAKDNHLRFRYLWRSDYKP